MFKNKNRLFIVTIFVIYSIIGGLIYYTFYRNTCIVNKYVAYKNIVVQDIEKIAPYFKHKKKLSHILFIGSLHYRISHKDVLAIIKIESNFNLYATGRNKDSIDYGLSQTNSKYLKQRYKTVKSIANKYGLTYTNNKYDMTLNILACYNYLAYIQTQVKEYKRYIISYNTGVAGSLYKKTGEKYYNKFIAYRGLL